MLTLVDDRFTMPWTSKEIDLLRKLVDEGASTQRIASRLNRSTRSVRGFAKTLGIHLKTTTEQRKSLGLPPRFTVAFPP